MVRMAYTAKGEWTNTPKGTNDLIFCKSLMMQMVKIFKVCSCLTPAQSHSSASSVETKEEVISGNFLMAQSRGEKRKHSALPRMVQHFFVLRQQMPKL